MWLMRLCFQRATFFVLPFRLRVTLEQPAARIRRNDMVCGYSQRQYSLIAAQATQPDSIANYSVRNNWSPIPTLTLSTALISHQCASLEEGAPHLSPPQPAPLVRAIDLVKKVGEHRYADAAHSYTDRVLQGTPAPTVRHRPHQCRSAVLRHQ